jgi:hypothetical protein
MLDDLFGRLSDINIFAQALIYAVLLWAFMWVMNSLFKNVAPPRQRLLLVMAAFALIGAGLTFLPLESFGLDRVPMQIYPALGAVIGYDLGPLLTGDELI